MTRAPLVVALALALAPPLALAQEPDQPVALSAWAGTYADASVRLEVRPTAGGFDGTITVKGTPYRAKGRVRAEGPATALEGAFTAGAKDYAFTATLEGADTLVLTSAGTTYRLARQTADAPRPAAEPAAPAPPAGQPDLSHVRVGQKYVYELQGGQLEMKFTVREVGPGLVRYDMETWMDTGQGLRPIGDPTPQVFRQGQVVGLDDEGREEKPGGDGELEQLVPQGGKTRRERVSISGQTFDCLVTEMEGVSTWTPMTGDVVTFPLIVRTRQGDDVVMDLVRIEQPD